MANVIKSARLIYVDVVENSNKFYYMDLYDNDDVRIWYGRYRELGGQLTTQSDETFTGGLAYFNKKYKAKTNPKHHTPYVEQPVITSTTPAGVPAVPKGSVKDIALKQIRSSTPKEVSVLITFLADVNRHNITSNTKITYNAITGQFQTASGLVNKEGIGRGRTLLGDIACYVDKSYKGKAPDKAFDKLVNEYLTIVPRDFGRSKTTPERLFPDMAEVQKQLGILDSLEGSLVEVDKPKGKDAAQEEKEELEQLFDAQLDLVEDPQEFDRIRKLYESTRKEMHVAASLKLKKVYRVVIAPMLKDYEARGKQKGNVQEKWHGTGPGNLLSILKSGLKVSPPSTAAIAGKAFGNGLYFSTYSTKSLNYAYGYHSGSFANRCWMFLNDIAIGKFHVPERSLGSSMKPPSGFDTIWAIPGQTSYLQNDEIIIFDSAQCNPKYLLEFEDR